MIAEMRITRPKADAAHVMQHATQAYGSALESGRVTQKDTSDVLELAFNSSICADPEKYNPCVGPAQAKGIIEELEKMMKLMPTQNRRDEECERFQQFSTPPHLAYLVSWVANLNDKDVVLEPSAGTGGLCCFAINSGATVYANEISERRKQLLKALPIARVFSENAEQIHNILPDDIQPTVVLMNPPFSTAGTRVEGKVRGAAHMHIDQAMLRLKDGGRLVAIIGDKLHGDDGSGRGQMSLEWWNEFNSKYAVRASIGFRREEYMKMGTNYPARLILCDKVPPCKTEVVEVGIVSGVVDYMNN